MLNLGKKKAKQGNNNVSDEQKKLTHPLSLKV